MANDRAAHRDPLALAAGKLAGLSLQKRFKLQHIRGMRRALELYEEASTLARRVGQSDVEIGALAGVNFETDRRIARRKIARFVGLADPDCLVFTRGTTEALNLVAASHGDRRREQCDEQEDGDGGGREERPAPHDGLVDHRAGAAASRSMRLMFAFSSSESGSRTAVQRNPGSVGASRVGTGGWDWGLGAGDGCV